MSNSIEYSTILDVELVSLNDDQRVAVTQKGSNVVRAGPGSGKTRTLVARVAYLLEVEIPRRQGVAAITYTRQAAREIDDRIVRLGLKDRHRLTCGTVHSWCMSSILRTYGPLVGFPVPLEGAVIDENDDAWVQTLQGCFDDLRIPNEAQYERAAITKIRRELAAGYGGERTRMVDAAEMFDRKLMELGLFDFDSMISSALKIVSAHAVVGRLLASRYPWIVIDEYQDLGPVLHRLVLTLHERYGVHVSAFGDPDQSVMGFTGADPRYMNELAVAPAFTDLALGVNYRCGSAIIAASHAALGEGRAYRPDPERNDTGIIDVTAADGGLDAHASKAVAKAEELLDSGVPAHQLAIIYPSRGILLDQLVEKLNSSPYDYVYERDDRLPDGDLIDFLRALAARSLSGPLPMREANSSIHVLPTYRLVRDFEDLRAESWLPRLEGRQNARKIARALRDVAHEQSTPVTEWLSGVVDLLELREIAEASPKLRDQEALIAFHQAAVEHGLTLADITTGSLRTGKISLTTYHSAKGREWDVVILPGLIDGIFPRRRWHKPSRRFAQPAPDQLSQDRRSFYVGLTRARRAVVLIYGEYWETPWGARNNLGISRFAEDIIRHLR